MFRISIFGIRISLSVSLPDSGIPSPVFHEPCRAVVYNRIRPILRSFARQRTMLNFLNRWFKINKGEAGMFAGALVLLFLVRSADMIFNNYAETAFLKRFGVEYLPIMYMVNSVSIFFVMGFMTGLLTRLPGSRLLTYLLFFCGFTVAGTRFLIPTGWDLVYPLLFIMKTLYEALLGLLFWNMANDLFNTRQSKRLFPLISAGGVCGDILAGFGTPAIAGWIMIDNLLLVYLSVTVAGALVVRTMGARYPTLLLAGGKRKDKRKRSSLVDEIRRTVPLMKASFLVKILLFMTFFPNVIIPIMNFQFNFVVNEMFATEAGLVAFLGYFRGSMNVVSLVILLFVGRIYGRWGLPVALMFHPTNYMFVFIGFLLRFDIFAAVYARLSTNVIRTTLHKPATDILMGLIPVDQRAVLRPFLRGTVVRVALLLGSASILIGEHLFHPRYLSLVALPCAAAWLGSILILKKRYSEMLIGLISKNQLDLKSMEEQDVAQLFGDRGTRNRLAEEFSAARGESAVWYARLLRSIGHPDLDRLLLNALDAQEPTVQIALIDMISAASNREKADRLKRFLEAEEPEVVSVALEAVGRLDPAAAADIDFERFLSGFGPKSAGYAAAALFRRNPDRHEDRIAQWLDSAEPDTIRAAVIAAGQAGRRRFAEALTRLTADDRAEAFRAEVIESLRRIGPRKDPSIFVPFLSHESSKVRHEALQAIQVTDDETLSRVIGLVGDSSRKIRALARQKIETAPHQNATMLIEALNNPRRRVRQQIYEILEALNIRDLDAYRYVREQAKKSYRCLAAAQRLSEFAPCDKRDLLIDHFRQKQQVILENALRVLAAQDGTGKMGIILRGILSSDSAQRSNGIEALDERLEKMVSKILLPLLEPADPAAALAEARRRLDVEPAPQDDAIFLQQLLDSKDWVVQMLTLAMIRRLELTRIVPEPVRRLTDFALPSVRRQASAVLHQTGAQTEKEPSMEQETTTSDKILLLRGIDIFEDLAVGELAAVASVTEEIDYVAGEVVIREGEAGEQMYLIIKGEVSVIKDQGNEDELELDRIGEGDYFGEMALFEDIERTATIRTEADSRLLILHKQEFTEIVREYPQIALEICKVLSGRIRRLHEKLKGG